VRQAGSSRVHRLRSLGLFFLRQGVLRKSAVRILLRLSRDPFMPRGFLADETPTCPHCFSPNASSLCGLATSSSGWYALGQGARPLSLHSVAKSLDVDADRIQR
jgi:hypothetical protein